MSDEIAYIHHDLEDGLRSRILQEEALAEFPLWQEALAAADPALRANPGLPGSVRRSQILVTLIDLLVTDLLEASAARIASAGVQTVDAAREWPDPLIGLSPRLATAVLELKRYLLEAFYRHPRVVRMTQKAEGTLAELYAFYRKDLALLPRWVRGRAEVEGEARAVSDYVAGMTDRFAMAEHQRLLDPHESR
jgi:dGTPase